MRGASGNAAGVRDEPPYATTLSRGIDVLACFSAHEPVLGNHVLAERTGLSRSAVARLIHTLLTLGYLQRDVASRRYRLGASVLTLAHPLLASMRIRQVARPAMKRLAVHANGAISLVMRDRTQMLFVESARSNEALQTRPDIGAALPMLTSAAGRAWLCRVPEALREEALNRLRVADPEHYARHIASLKQAQRDMASRGFCGNDGAWRPDAYGFAVAMSQPVDAQWLVFNCGVPAEDGPYASRADDIGPRLVEMVRDIEGVLGMRG